MTFINDLLLDINGNIHQKFFPSPFQTYGHITQNAVLASSELENIFNEGYSTPTDFKSYSSFPHRVLTQTLQWISPQRFANLTTDSVLAPHQVVLLAEDEKLTPPERWTIIVLLYLLAQLDDNFDEQVEKLRVECRVPLELHDIIVKLVQLREWNAGIENRKIYVEGEFCKKLTALVANIVEEETKRISVLDGLQPRSYQHPTDRFIQKAVSVATPGMSKLTGWFINKYKRPQELILKANNQFVTLNSNPRLFKIFNAAARILDLKDVPTLYIDPMQRGINAYATGTDEKTYVAVSQDALLLLDDRELLFLLGHELGHIQCDHLRYHTMMDVLNTLNDISIAKILGVSAFNKATTMTLLNAWFRRSEISADRAGLLCSQSSEAALRVMMKMSGVPWNQYHQIRTRTFIDQAVEYQKTTNDSSFDRFFSLMNVAFSEHPFTVYRAVELLAWIQNGEYDEHVNTDRAGRETLARRILDDANNQVFLKEAERFITDWLVEKGYPRKSVARELRKMLYEHTTPQTSPLNRIGYIDLDITQTAPDSFDYAVRFLIVEQNAPVEHRRVLQKGVKRDDISKKAREFFLKTNKPTFSERVYKFQ